MRTLLSVSFTLFAFTGSSFSAQVKEHELPGLTGSGGFGSSLCRIRKDSTGTFDTTFTNLLIGSPHSNTAGLWAGSVRIVDGGSTAVLRTHLGESAGDQFGFSACALSDLNGDSYTEYAVGAPFDDTNGVDAGAVYVYDGQTGNLLKKLLGGFAGDQFGFSIASVPDANANGTDEIIVGSPYYNSGALTDAGRAQLFSTSTWFVLDSITGTTSLEHLGWSVAGVDDVSGDGLAEYAVGSPHYSTSRGRVQLVNSVTGAVIRNWMGASTGDLFGFAIAAQPSQDAGSTKYLAVGSPGRDTGGSGSGALYCLNAGNGNQLWVLNGSSAGGSFGAVVAYAGEDEVSGPDPISGLPTTFMIPCFAAGAPKRNVGLLVEAGRLEIVRVNGPDVLETFNGDAAYAHMGAAACWMRSAPSSGGGIFGGSTPSRQSYAYTAAAGGAATVAARVWAFEAGYSSLFPGAPGEQIGILALHTAPQTGVRRGAAVAGLGDLTGDGRSDFAVGSPLEDTAEVQAGAVRIYSGSSFAQIEYIPGTDAASEFGAALAPAGDVNGDGTRDVVVGAPLFNGAGGVNSGGVFVYSPLTGTILRAVYGSSIGDELGRSVAGGGDINNDGRDDFVAGAPEYDGLGSDSGMVRAYSGLNGGQLYSILGVSGDGRLGASVAIAGDVNLDGFVDFAAGAPGISSGAGQARIYSGASGSLIRTITTSDSLDFGRALAAGDVNMDGRSDLLVGARKKGFITASNQGAVLVYSGVNGAQILNVQGKPIANDQFGVSIAFLGDVNQDGFGDFAAGASIGGPVSTDYRGAVRVHSGADGLLLHEVLGEDAGDRFGSALAAAGDITQDGISDWIAGAADSDEPVTNAGGVWFYSSAPEQLSRFGLGTFGCLGPEPIWGNVTPNLGTDHFRLSLTKAPPSSLVLGLVTNERIQFGADPFGIDAMLHVDLLASTTIVTLDMPTDASGRTQVGLPIPNIGPIQGTHFYAQTISAWPATACTPSTYGLSSSQGLDIFVQ